MLFKKPLKIFLWQAANSVIALALIITFSFEIHQLLKTVRMARYVGLGTLKPSPMDYLWNVNMHHAAINKNTIRYWADYEENLLKVFPDLVDAYGILGYCYHCLGDDLKAKAYFKKAVDGDPHYFWYFYDLAILNINDHHYQEAVALLQKGMQLEPQASLNALSSFALYPLLPQGSSLQDVAAHLKEGYQHSFILLNILNSALAQGKADSIKQLQFEIYVL